MADWERDLTQDEARRLFSYDPETGQFTRLVRQGMRGLPGPVQSWASLRQGYLLIKTNKRSWFAHRLAWLWMFGHPIPAVIDHANGDPADNGIENLRPASAADNAANRKRPANNSVGVKGVSRAGRGYRATITVRGKQSHLGRFKTLEEARNAYAIAARDGFGEFARTE